ncbi:hypothetical protein P2H44_25250 [Albimonas sp. CAU 1670]|uniref:hypothetical protein n=1 Tax=Albimonas sp. CAU 1670 TaxID=3032599 RepID=UPI0023DC8EE8|nr:hypothetical protein [Albimonas sp. CAU 1670]MDF2235873.1 hypothetical protein [Albimonas sp. CAU 1670]
MPPLRTLSFALLALSLAAAATSPLAASSREDLIAAETAMKESAKTLQSGISDAMSLISSINGDGEEAAAQGDEVLQKIRQIQQDAYVAVDQLALNGPFINALSEVRVEIRQTQKRIERLEPSENRDRMLASIQRQSALYNELQESIVAKEGEITLLLGQFARLEKEIELSLKLGEIVQLVEKLQDIEDSLSDMTGTLGQVLQYDVGEVAADADISMEN